VIIKAPFLS